MLETKDLYKDYIGAIELKLATVNNKITQYYGSEAYLKQCIINNRAEFEKVDVSVDNLLSNPFIAYAKIKPLVDNGQLTRVAHYVKSYVTALNYLTLHKKLAERLQKAIMPYEVYLKFVSSNNNEIAKHILKGESYTFGQAGKLYIKEKERTFFFKGRPVPLPVDWGTSKKIKAKIIEEGNTPYNKAEAPDGIKWHTYHDSDFAYWFWWEAGAIENRAFFKFYPSKFGKKGADKKIVFKTEEDILNTTKIGILNKMLELMRINPIYFINYRRPEKRNVVFAKCINS